MCLCSFTPIHFCPQWISSSNSIFHDVPKNDTETLFLFIYLLSYSHYIFHCCSFFPFYNWNSQFSVMNYTLNGPIVRKSYLCKHFGFFHFLILKKPHFGNEQLFHATVCMRLIWVMDIGRICMHLYSWIQMNIQLQNAYFCAFILWAIKDARDI